MIQLPNGATGYLAQCAKKFEQATFKRCHASLDMACFDEGEHLLRYNMLPKYVCNGWKV